MKQSEAVIKFFHEAVEAGHPADVGSEVTQSFIIAKMEEGLADGTIPWSGNRADPAAVRTYAKGVTRNHLKRQPSLNNGVKYVPEQKRGPLYRNPLIKELKESVKVLRLNNYDEAVIQRVEERIELLKQEEKASRPGTPSISLDQVIANLSAQGIQGL